MSEPTPKKSTKSTAAKWNTAQRLGFWFLLTAVTMFWSGVYIGSVSTQTSINDRESAKTQAVEEYKAELLKESQ